jgi:hypothetical protein
MDRDSLRFSRERLFHHLENSSTPGDLVAFQETLADEILHSERVRRENQAEGSKAGNLLRDHVRRCRMLGEVRSGVTAPMEASRCRP